MKKRMLIILLSLICALCLAFGLTACNKGTTGGGTSGGTEQSGTEQGDDEQDGTEQDGTEQDGTEQDGTEQDGTEQDGTEQDGTEQDGTEQDGTEQGGDTEQGDTEQGGTEQGGTEQGGTTHTHTPVKTEGIEATCTESGNIEYWYCSGCEKYFSDEDCTREITLADTVISATGHKATKIDEVTATCSTAGNTEYWYCSACDKYFSDEECTKEITLADTVISATGHKATKIDEVTATCSTAGNTEYWYCSACDKYFSDEECTKEITFADTVIATTAHSYVYNYDEDGDGHWQVCSVCGEETETEAHKLDENNICSVCGYKKLVDSIGLAYKLSDDETYYTVSGIGECTDTEIVIPSKYHGVSVTAIATSAFSGQAQILSVYVPDSVTSIGDRAFYNCTSLASITISDGVTSIGNSVFYNCTSLEGITIPDGVTSIGTYAFYNCTALTEINFNATAMNDLSSKNYVFYCAGQSGDGITVTIGATVTKIPAQLFEPSFSTDAPNIKSVVFEDNSICTSIGSGAFEYCTSLTSVCYSGTASQWASISFESPSSNPLYYADLYLNGTLATDITIEGITTINTYAFYNCSSLISVTIGSNVQTIGRYAFYNCISLASVTIGSNVETIDSYAFSWCTSLTGIIISDSVTSIGGSTFSGCRSLESITIPFVGGSAEATEASESTLFGYIFGTSNYTGGTLTSQYYAGNSPKIYYIPTTLTAVTITGSNILYGAFYGCSELTSVTIGDSVTSIGNYVFYGCSKLTSVTIGDGVASIGDDAFCGCAVTSVTIPDGVTSIGKAAFSNCGLLESVTISESVISIGNSVFYNCKALTEINFNAIAMNDLLYENNVFYKAGQSGDGITVTIGANVTKIPAYMFRYVYITNLIFEDSSVCTSIGSYAFYECISLESVTIPDSVISIGSYAFAYCSGIKSITIGSSVKTIGTYVFCECTELSEIKYNAVSADGFSVESNYGFYYAGQYSGGIEVTVGAAVKTLPKYIFNTCSYLKSIVFEEGSVCESIGYGAFLGCKSLANIELPDSVTSIGLFAFQGCTSLTNIELSDNVTSIGAHAFHGCTKLTTVKFGTGLTSIGYAAFYNCSALTSATFAITDGWWYTSSNTATSGTALSISDDAENNATLIMKVTTTNYINRTVTDSES